MVKLNQISGGTLTTPVHDETGVFNGIYLPGKYLAYQDVDGKPLSIFLQGSGNFEFSTGKINHKAIAGGEWTFDKNYGKGQIFDRLRPPGGTYAIRPRKYSDIPAKYNLNFLSKTNLPCLSALTYSN